MNKTYSRQELDDARDILMGDISALSFCLLVGKYLGARDIRHVARLVQKKRLEKQETFAHATTETFPIYLSDAVYTL